MHHEGGVTLDKNGTVVSVGGRTVRFMAPGIRGSLPCYAEGHLSKSDLVVLVVPDCSDLSRNEKEAIASVYLTVVPEGGALLIVSSCGNYESEPLIRVIGKWQPGVLLDTIFCGQHVKVSVTRGEAAMEINILSGCHSLAAPVGSEFIVLATASGALKYFNTGDTSGGRDSLASIIKGGRYRGYVDTRYIRHHAVSIDSLFLACIRDAMRRTETSHEDPVELVKTEDEDVLVTFMGRSPDLGDRTWVIASEGDIMSDIQSSFNDYSLLVGHREALMTSLSSYSFGLSGDDGNIRRVRYLLTKVSATNTTVLLTGESGSGKSFVAHEIHNCSRRSKMPFIDVNCAAIPYSLMESELFGYDDGAFTGARRGGKAGYFRMAEGGTIFLDEISEIPLALQGKLLEVIQNRSYFKVGGTVKQNCDVRIIVATNCDLKALVAEHRFREDLLYRINVFPVGIPPLRDRMESLFGIIADILPAICSRLGVEQRYVSEEAFAKMRGYSWPGNVRELENILEKACILSDGRVIRAVDVDIPTEQTEVANQAQDLRSQMEQFEKKVIEKALHKTSGSRVAAARMLNISRTALFNKLRKHGLMHSREGE